MSKTLHLIRHAKSSWEFPHLADIDRPLNRRGEKACRIMAQPIVDAGCDFENVFCSPALRAQSTISGIADSLQRDIRWTLDDYLYTFSASDLFDWCQRLDESLSAVVIVGHNPGMTEFCNALCDSDFENLPTCAYVRLEIEECYWADLSPGCAELLSFLKPKMF